MSMQLYAVLPVAAQVFTDDADFIATQVLGKRPRIKLRGVYSTVAARVHAVAVDANGEHVAAEGTFSIDVIEIIERREIGDEPASNLRRAPYLGSAGVTTISASTGESEDISIGKGSYVLRFTGAALLPAGATQLRIYVDTGQD